MNVETIYGELDDSLLVRTAGVIDLPTEFKIWVEYRLRDTPEVAMLRKLQFPRIHTTEAGSWEVCVDCTGSREGGHTPSCKLAALLRAADVRGAQVVCRMEGVLFQKTNPFDAPSPGGVVTIDGVEFVVPPGHITADFGDGLISVVPEQKLHKSTAIDADNDHEFTCSVEYRTDDGRLVHRSVHAVAKKAMDLFPAAEGNLAAGGGNA